MSFDWLTALYGLIICAMPISILAGSWAYVAERPVLTTFWIIVFLTCVFLLGGLPEPMTDITI